jgi:UvrD-like helicase C-terminal domain/UvrD/REP helicase N-terminal domain
MMPRTTFVPTQEQEDIRTGYRTGQDLVIRALAGTGKTTSLEMLARDDIRKRMTYVAFNRSIADEAARRFPSNVTCQPAGTMVRVPVGQGGSGAVSFEEVPIESLVDGDKVVSWNTNHGGLLRKRGRSIQVGHRDYDGPLVTVRADDRCSRYTPQHKCVVSIGDAFAGQYVVYMMRRNGLYRIGMVAWDTKQGVRNGMLMRALAQKCDAFWILSAHDDREDAILTEQLTQYDFNVPGWRFVSERSGIDTILWTKIDPSRNAINAEFCLSSFGRSVEHPLWTSADHGRLAKSHMVTIAANLMTGMRVLVADNCEAKTTNNGFTKSHAPLRLWSRIEVSSEWYTGKVYSMNVDDDETYVGDGIVTHNCKTMHSFAFAAIGRHFSDRLNGPRIPAWKAANILRIPELFEFGAFSLRSHQLARLTLEAVNRFCHSDASEPSRRHIPRIPGLESSEARTALEQLLFPFVITAWRDLSSDRGELRFNHDVYLKLYAMTNPQLPGDVVLADEAQDFDPVIKQIVEGQTNSQKIYVGDTNQTIYEWRGSVDALNSVQDALAFPLQKSFRFGPVIAAEANRILEVLDSPLRLEGHEPVDSKLAFLMDNGAADCVLTRTNAEAIARLMNAQMSGVRAGLVGGTAQVEALAKAALDLSEGRKTTHPELVAFNSWNQVRDYVAEDPDAKEIQVLVKLVDRHGPYALLEAVQRAVPEQSADLLLSTAHKGKGREWDRVLIAGDFSDPRDEETGEWVPGELRLAYVAVTRAKKFLDCSNLSWLTELARFNRNEDEPQRYFLTPEEVPEREGIRVAVDSSPTEQVIPDPEDATRLMFRGTKYDPELVVAQRTLPRSKYYGIYCGHEKVRVVLATAQALAIAERFGLTVSQAARDRVAELAG